MVTLMRSQTDRPDEEYFALVDRFPLVPIRDEPHLDAAMAVIDELIDRANLTRSEQDYLDVLSDLVERFEDEQVDLPDVSGLAVLKHLMTEHNLRQSDLVPLFGSKSIVSEVLSGKRRIALNHVAKLSAYFGVPADVFLDL